MIKTRGIPKILIVEDEEYISKLYSAILSEKGLEIDIAEHGEEARKMLLDTTYSLVICDIKMPRMDGEKLYRWVQSERPEQAERWIFATGSVMGEEHRSFLESSGRPVLLKPFNMEEFINTVEKTLHEVQ